MLSPRKLAPALVAAAVLAVVAALPAAGDPSTATRSATGGIYTPCPTPGTTTTSASTIGTTTTSASTGTGYMACSTAGVGCVNPPSGYCGHPFPDVTSAVTTTSTEGTDGGIVIPGPCGSGGPSGPPRCSSDLRAPAVLARQAGSTIRVRASGLVRKPHELPGSHIPCSGALRVAIGRRGSTTPLRIVTVAHGSLCHYRVLTTFSVSKLPRSLRPRRKRLTLSLVTVFDGAGLLAGTNSPFATVRVTR